jgi:hypothetical protein
MATPRSVLTKTAVLGATLALAGLSSTSAQAQEARAQAPAFVNLTGLSANAPDRALRLAGAPAEEVLTPYPRVSRKPSATRQVASAASSS